jgi:hypothetical protein
MSNLPRASVTSVPLEHWPGYGIANPLDDTVFDKHATCGVEPAGRIEKAGIYDGAAA